MGGKGEVRVHCEVEDCGKHHFGATAFTGAQHCLRVKWEKIERRHVPPPELEPKVLPPNWLWLLLVVLAPKAPAVLLDPNPDDVNQLWSKETRTKRKDGLPEFVLLFPPKPPKVLCVLLLFPPKEKPPPLPNDILAGMEARLAMFEGKVGEVPGKGKRV